MFLATTVFVMMRKPMLTVAVCAQAPVLMANAAWMMSTVPADAALTPGLMPRPAYRVRMENRTRQRLILIVVACVQTAVQTVGIVLWRLIVAAADAEIQGQGS